MTMKPMNTGSRAISPGQSGMTSFEVNSRIPFQICSSIA